VRCRARTEAVACTPSIFFVIEGLLAVPIQGSLALFLAAAGVNLFATTSLGILLATVARSVPQFALLTMLVIMPLEMLSGGMTPRESMPAIVQNVMLVAPTTQERSPEMPTSQT
jgi:ABC-2 type transport system permease protein